MYTLILSTSLLFGPICPSGCPVLIGKETPTGVFRAFPMAYQAIGFNETPDGIMAIHPPHTPARASMLKREKRPVVTNGCVNISADTFQRLPRRSFLLEIRP